jgi:2-(1,2-epoxy-1,2-dihydrophenyl)acetyl-CoA isomerase
MSIDVENDPPAEDLLSLTQEGAIARIKLTRPRSLNALSVRLASALMSALRTAVSNPHARVLLLSGEGLAFMAGGDLRYLAQDGPGLASARADTLIGHLHDLIEIMVAFPIPIVTAVHGAVAGAGLSVMLASDFVVAAADTRFVFAYSNLGTSPDGGLTWFLARSLGIRLTMQWAFLQKQLSADEALRHGLIQQISLPATLAEDAIDLTHRLAATPLHAFHCTKQLLWGASTTTLKEQLASERLAFVRCARTRDFAEGLAAFTERRSPNFSLARVTVKLPMRGTSRRMSTA